MVTFHVGVITEDNGNYYKSTTTAMDTLIFKAKIIKKVLIGINFLSKY